MKTTINKLGVNSTPSEEVSLTVEGSFFVHDTNILEELKALQSSLSEISQIKKTLETLKELVEALGKDVEVVATQSEQDVSVVEAPKKVAPTKTKK